MLGWEENHNSLSNVGCNWLHTSYVGFVSISQSSSRYLANTGNIDCRRIGISEHTTASLSLRCHRRPSPVKMDILKGSWSFEKESKANSTGASIKIAFLGTRHPHVMYRFAVLEQIGSFEFTGFYEEVAENATKLADKIPSLKRFSTPEDLLNANPDVVMIYSLDPDVPKWARFAINHPTPFRGLFLEKPGAARPEDFYTLAQEIVSKKPGVAVELGYEMHYSGGESEKSMGAAIRKYGWKRNDLVLSTKLYFGGAYGHNNVNNFGLSRKHIVEALDSALARLDLKSVDLVYAHRPDRNTPIEETVRAFNHVIAQGKAFYWGTSEWSASEIATAWRYADKLGLIGHLMEQPGYSMLQREKVEAEYDHLCEETGMGLTIFSPLKSGILTGKYNDGIPGIRASQTRRPTPSSRYGRQIRRRHVEGAARDSQEPGAAGEEARLHAGQSGV